MNLDPRPWADQLYFLSHGIRIGVRLSDAGLRERLAERLPPGSRACDPGVAAALFSLVVGGGGASNGRRSPHVVSEAGVDSPIARTFRLTEALAALEVAIRRRVAVACRRRLFVHAGVVGWHGRAIILPGRSGSGKTTLVAALVEAGATYYSDEFAVLDGRARVHPYAKPLDFRRNPRGLRVRRPVAGLGGETGARPLPTGMVWVTAYERGRRTRLRELSPGQAVLALFRHTLVARIRPAFALDTLRRAVAGTTAASGPRGDAAEAVQELLGYVESQSTRSGTSRIAGARDHRRAGPGGTAPGSTRTPEPGSP